MKPIKPLTERLGTRILEQLRTRKITNKEAANKLGCSESYLSRVVAAMQEKEPGQTVIARKANAELASARKALRNKLASQVVRGKLTMADAAEQANCSERTMFRYVARHRP